MTKAQKVDAETIFETDKNICMPWFWTQDLESEFALLFPTYNI